MKLQSPMHVEHGTVMVVEDKPEDSLVVVAVVCLMAEIILEPVAVLSTWRRTKQVERRREDRSIGILLVRQLR